MLVLDHIAVAAETLAEGAAHVEAALGVELSDIGVHDRMGTHNRLLGLGPGRVSRGDRDQPRCSAPGAGAVVRSGQLHGATPAHELDRADG